LHRQEQQANRDTAAKPQEESSKKADKHQKNKSREAAKQQQPKHDEEQQANVYNKCPLYSLAPGSRPD
jgi:hypothetical protein